MADCEDGDVRLVGGNTQYEGRVEVCINRVWGTVCSSMWGTRNSDVICKQLGHMELGTMINDHVIITRYTSAGSITYLTASQFGQGTGPILMSAVDCSGQESNLLNCPYQPFSNSICTHHHDVGVKCEGIIIYDSKTGIQVMTILIKLHVKVVHYV